MSQPVLPSVRMSPGGNIEFRWSLYQPRAEVSLTEEELLGLILAYDAFTELQDVLDDTVVLTPEGREALECCDEPRYANPDEVADFLFGPTPETMSVSPAPPPIVLRQIPGRSGVTFVLFDVLTKRFLVESTRVGAHTMYPTYEEAAGFADCVARL